MTRLVKALLSILCFALIVGGALAQTADPPIFSYRNGDIWKYDLTSETATQLTTWGFNGGPILSPDGSKIAYLSVSSEFVTQFEAGTATQTGGTAPANIWVMDVATESFTLIADQAGASAAGILRSLPNWSPDSSQLVWLQVDPGAQTLDAAQLIIHHLHTGVTSALVSNVDLGFQGNSVSVPSLRWGEGGIARLHFDYHNGADNPFLHIQFFDPVSGASKQYDLGLNQSRDNTVRDFIWVNHLGRSMMALQIKDYWELIDPQDGSRSRLRHPPRLHNRNRAGGLQLIPVSVDNGSGGWFIHWHATNGVNTFDTTYKSHRVNRNNRPGLSGDGLRIAWQNSDRVSTWQIGSEGGNRPVVEVASRWAFPIPQPFGLVWAPGAWVTTGALSTAQSAPSIQPIEPSCAPPPLLSPGPASNR